MTSDQIFDALDYHNWGCNRKPELNHAAFFLAGLPVVEVEDESEEEGGGLRVKFERPLTQSGCFSFIRGLSFEDVLNGPVTDDQTEFRVWWD